MLSRSDLHHYQERAIQFIKDKQRCMLLLDMGLGKTITTLTTLSDLHDGLAVKKTLIIAPLRVANSVWAQESRKWQHTQHLRVSVVTGSERKRISALQYDADVYVINRENIPWLVEHYSKRFPFDAIIIDESSSFKNPSSRRFKMLKKVAHLADYMVLLTGTPAPNGLLDMWAQMWLVDYGASLGKTMTAYKQRFFEQDYMGYNYKPRPGSALKINALISDRAMSMQAKDYLELPERIDLIETVSLTPSEQKQYDDFERELLIEIDGAEILAQSAATLAGKLLQWCSGAVYTDDKGNYHVTSNAKIDALKELMETLDGENVLVAYNFKSDLERLQQAFPDAVVLDKENRTIDRWNDGQIKMLLAHPQSAGHGLNLQHGGSVIIWFSLQWNLEYYQQFNGRLHRQGQTKPVRIIHLVTKDCLDERVMKAISAKDATQAKLLDALKR
jgi:SNF2 family DNA or RNA helicase